MSANQEPNYLDFSVHSTSIHTHLDVINSIIQRMASNSASCKAWCIALVTAVLVIVADKGKPQYSLVAIIPIALFMILDTYYLALERTFRKSYNEFIGKLHERHLISSDLYAVTPSGSLLRTFFNSLLSFSVWPFYLTLLVLTLVAKALV